MKLFQENPGDIFPFDIEGATSFVTGDTIRLLDSTGQPTDDEGWVECQRHPPALPSRLFQTITSMVKAQRSHFTRLKEWPDLP